MLHDWSYKWASLELNWFYYLLNLLQIIVMNLINDSSQTGVLWSPKWLLFASEQQPLRWHKFEPLLNTINLTIHLITSQKLVWKLQLSEFQSHIIPKIFLTVTATVFNVGQTRPVFVYFRRFLNTICSTKYDWWFGGIQTLDCRNGRHIKSTELWQPPLTATASLDPLQHSK